MMREQRIKAQYAYHMIAKRLGIREYSLLNMINKYCDNNGLMRPSEYKKIIVVESQGRKCVTVRTNEIAVACSTSEQKAKKVKNALDTHLKVLQLREELVQIATEKILIRK